MSKRKNALKKRQQEFIQTLSFFLVTVFSIGGLIVYLWVFTEIDESIMAIEVQRSTMNELNNTIKELKSDISRLNRVDRITSVAMDALGMIVADPESTMVHMDPSLLENNFD